MSREKGLVLVYTGNGKGKTTAALGLAVRALGHDQKVCIIQFLKSPSGVYGEKNLFEKLGVEIYQTGIGFTHTKTPEEHRAALQKAWQLAKEKLMSERYDLIVLDEINYALDIKNFSIDDILPIDEVVEAIKNRKGSVNVVLTGRNVKDKIIELADLVTVLQEEKHYYHLGIPAVKGVEY